MEREIKQIIRQKITDALAASVPVHTRRDVHLPAIKGKALAVIGMRRSGKTTFLWQCLGARLESGTPRDALLYFNFEDERLAEMTAQELQFVVEEYFSLHPERRDSMRVTFFLDEIQEVPGWETFVRRLLDTEKVELFLSGSSARLLSREVASSMRSIPSVSERLCGIAGRNQSRPGLIYPRQLDRHWINISEPTSRKEDFQNHKVCRCGTAPACSVHTWTWPSCAM
jgi:hypothetical protein